MNAIVNINTTQFDEHGIVDSIKIESRGNIYTKNNATYILYKENIDGKEIKTTIKVVDDKVSVKKSGTVLSNMVFTDNEHYTSKYSTPYGIFNVDIKTNYLNINIKENEYIRIQIEYNINVVNLFVGKNKMDIDIKILNK